ncbi:MAG: DUF1330 domain-containing protein, partial [Acidimicrobiales bacterium]
MTDAPRYGLVDRDLAMRFAATAPEDDGPIWMVNLIKYRERADYGDGADAGVSGAEADARYAERIPLEEIGAQVVFWGDVDAQLLGAEPRWDRVGVVRYPSRRAFLAMQQRDDFREAHQHKKAALESTIVIAGVPIESPPLPDDAPAWDAVPHPPTDDDPDVMVLHVLKYKDDERRQEMASYTDHAALVAVPHGVRVAAWFEAEGTIVGDGRQWHQARFNAFPSKEAFMAVVFDPARLEAQKDHREVAIEDTYTLIVRPTINRLAESLRGSIAD